MLCNLYVIKNNMKFLSKIVLLVALPFFMVSCDSGNKGVKQNESVEIDSTLANWQNQKYSMFIHWGLYSIPAGVWNGEKISGYSEQIKGHAKIPTAEYHKLAKQFNPTKWSADSIALLAKKAGMKSIVITSKHHDGFCMFDSKFTDFDIVDATPYKADILKELSEACKRHNLKFGVYFSLIDWDYKEAMPFTSVRNSDSIPPLHHQYNLNQIEELLTNYGEISEIWFDMSSPTFQQSKEIADLVKREQPGCMISGRIWNDQGDFAVMGDNYQPDFKMGVPWQTPASMFDETWSYRSWQERVSVEEKVAEKIEDLLNIVSSGGNYLLNIGPKADGSVVPFEKSVLEGVGEWLDKNGESVYGSNAALIQEQEWGVITSKGNKLYFHLFNYPEDNRLVIRGLDIDVEKIYPLSDKSLLLKSEKFSDSCVVELSDKIEKNKYVTTFVLEFENDFIATPQNLVEPNNENNLKLTLENAEKFHSYSGHDYYSTKPTIIKLKWHLSAVSKETSEMDVTFISHKNEKFKLTINKQDFIISPRCIDREKNLFIYEIRLNSVKLNSEKNNEIELSFLNQNNPHRGMDIGDLVVLFW